MTTLPGYDLDAPPPDPDRVEQLLSAQGQELQTVLRALGEEVAAGLTSQEKELRRVTDAIRRRIQSGLRGQVKALIPVMDAIHGRIASNLAEQQVALSTLLDQAPAPACPEGTFGSLVYHDPVTPTFECITLAQLNAYNAAGIRTTPATTGPGVETPTAPPPPITTLPPAPTPTEPPPGTYPVPGPAPPPTSLPPAPAPPSPDDEEDECPDPCPPEAGVGEISGCATMDVVKEAKPRAVFMIPWTGDPNGTCYLYSDAGKARVEAAAARLLSADQVAAALGADNWRELLVPDLVAEVADDAPYPPGTNPLDLLPGELPAPDALAGQAGVSGLLSTPDALGTITRG